MHQILSSAGYTGEGRLGRRVNSNQLSPLTTQMPPLLMFACGWKHNVFLTKEHQIYVCGENSDGQLGPVQGTCLEPTLSPILSELKPIWVACGDKITALLTESKNVYVCGCEWGPEPVCLSPSSDRTYTPIVYIACGIDNICGISAEGKLYVWYRKSQVAKQFECPETLCDVAAGKNQIFGLSTTGNLWVMGHSKSCGMGKKWSSLVLTKVPLDVPIKRIFAHSVLSIAIDVEGKVYVCGTNHYGELGIPELNKANTFQHLSAMDGHPVYMATIGDTFVAYITEKFELYTCGDGDEYRLCNAKIDKVMSPSKATATEGHKIMWACAGCSHIILAEGLDEAPVHPGREFFKLEGTMKLRSKKYSPQLIEMQVSNQLLAVDITDRGMAWTCFLPGDEIVYDGKSGKIVGCTSNTIVMDMGNELQIYTIKSLPDMHRQIKLIKRDAAVLEPCKTKSGLQTMIDTSIPSCRNFGFAPNDIVNDTVLEAKAQVIGVLGAALWFKYLDGDFSDNGAIVSLQKTNDIPLLHQYIKIIEPNNRKIQYINIKKTEYPIETEPCSLLNDFSLLINDLVDFSNNCCEIIGTFRHFVVVKNIVTQDFDFAYPNELILLRRYTGTPKFITYLTLTGKYEKVNISCSPDDEYQPFDRVLTQKGCATIVGKSEDGEKWWILPDESTALGAGVASTKQPFLALLRRVSQKECLFNDIDVSCANFPPNGKYSLLPDDVIIYENEKYRVIGMKNGKVVLEANKTGKNISVLFNKVRDNCSIVFRADLPARRMYYSKAGNGLFLSVSSKDFIGLRFLPDDVIKTPNGIGLVVGVSESDVCIHLNETRGVSFFPLADLYNVKDFTLIDRRSIKSVIVPKK